MFNIKKKIKVFLAKILFKPVAWLFAEIIEEVEVTKKKCFYCGRYYRKPRSHDKHYT